MNENNEIVQLMISFIEQKEKDLQASKLSDNQSRKDIVKSILDELEKAVK